MTTKIGILGSGVVAKTLAAGFVKHGYQVSIGTNHPQKLESWHFNNATVQIDTFEGAANFGEIIVLAVKGSAASTVLSSIKGESLANKTIIDTTNPISESAPTDGVIHFFTDLNSSLLEQLQASFAQANFVKAFNSIGSGFMVNPDFNGGTPSMFICGNSTDAKLEVKTILLQFGFEAEDMGKATAARAIEPLCILWCIPGFLRNEWSHAFKLLK